MGLFNKKKQNKQDEKNAEKSVKLDNDSEKLKNKEIKKVNNQEQKKKESRKHGNAYKILIKPLITEKASDLGIINKYMFEVAKNANKIETAKAIKEVYGVKPISVNIINMKGKKVRYGKTVGKKKDWKKAIITLKKGENIKIYEGV